MVVWWVGVLYYRVWYVRGSVGGIRDRMERRWLGSRDWDGEFEVLVVGVECRGMIGRDWDIWVGGVGVQ